MPIKPNNVPKTKPTNKPFSVASGFLKPININKPIKVAIMGCIVNGIGENKNADIGVAGSKECYVIFKKGEIIKKAKEDEIFDLLVEEINKLI